MKGKEQKSIFSLRRNGRKRGGGLEAIVNPPSYALFDGEKIIERMRGLVGIVHVHNVVCIIVVRRAGWGISGRR